MRLSTTRRAWLVAAIVLLSAWATSATLTRASDELIHVIVLHTNDVHGQAQPRPATWVDRENPPPVGGLPRIAAYVKRVRREAKRSGSGVLVVDGGDWFQGTPEGLVDQGRAFVNAISKVGYDAMAVGNHELDHGVEPLAAMIADFGVPALCANVLQEEGGEHLSWAKPWKVVELPGLRVGIVGLLTPSTPSITHRDASALHFLDPADALAQAKEALESKVDWILPITHLGVQSDRRLAKAHPELALIVGGHSHTYLKQGTRQDSTFIVQSGSKASAVGRVDLWFDARTKEVKETRYEMVDLLPEPEKADRNEAVDKICMALVAASEREMNEPVGELLDPLVRAFRKHNSSAAGNLITDTMRAHLDAHVAVQNRGGIRCDLPKGTVTRRGLFELLPFGNHLVLLDLSGAELFECLRASVEGTAHTGLEVSGVEVLYGFDEAGKAKLVDLLIAGESIEPDRRYHFATNNFLAGGGDGYDLLKEAKVIREDPLLMRELLEQRFRREKKISLPAQERYRQVER